MVVLLVLLVGLIVDYLLLPGTYVVAAPFALATILAGRRYTPRLTALTAACSLVLYEALSLYDSAPLSVSVANGITLVVVGYVGVLLAQQRREAERVQQELLDGHRRLLRFLSLVAHDMRQPLTAIHGYAQMLRRGSPRSLAEQRAIDALELAAERLRRLTDDLTDAGAVGTGGFQIRTGPVDLADLLRRIVAEQQAATQRHVLRLDAPERLIGIWDADRLDQLFGNLINNAVKYSPKGGEVQVTVYHADEVVVITVADQGVGIAPRQRQFLFQPFSRLENSGAGGTGLGLFICRGIAEAHGGTISQEDGLAGGAVFRVALPLVASSAEPPEDRARPVRHPGSMRHARRIPRDELEPETGATQAGEFGALAGRLRSSLERARSLTASS